MTGAVAGPVPGVPAALPALRRAAQDFEAQALGALLQPMFEGLEARGPFGGGAAEAQWRPMLVEAIARGMARTGGVGLADAVLREMLRLQGGGEAEEVAR